MFFVVFLSSILLELSGVTSFLIVSISEYRLSSRFVLAPLAGYTDLPFRSLCRENGAELCFSEMISCHALCYRQQKTLAMLATSPIDHPVAFQLFGADPVMMAEAASIMADFSPDLIDINMGCPVKKVTRKGAGAALMAEPKLAENIIQQVQRAVSIPVTVKIRSGTDSNHITAVEFAKMAEQAGASVITVHGRTWAQGFSGLADWSQVAAVKRAVSVPVIGNGDITSYTEGVAHMQDTGCDAVMIGRAALINPGIFSGNTSPLSLAECITLACRHLELFVESNYETVHPAAIRNRVGRYFHNFPNSSAVRKFLYASTTFEDLHERLQMLRSQSNQLLPETSLSSADFNTNE